MIIIINGWGGNQLNLSPSQLVRVYVRVRIRAKVRIRIGVRFGVMAVELTVN